MSTYLPLNDSQGFRHDLKIYLAEVAAEAGEDFAIGMDVERQVGGEGEFFEFAHANLFETHVCAIHEFGYEAEHHPARNPVDDDVFHFAVIVL